MAPLRAFLFSLLLIAGSCSLETRTLHVGPAVFRTELALTPEQHQKGLMGRTGLTDDQAMLFVFPDETPRVFWMKNTPSPLSIAYIAQSGEIKEILDMEPYSLAPVESRHIVKYALEVAQGAFTRRGVKVGDFIAPDDIKEFSAGR